MGRESRNSRREADDEGTSSSVGAATGSRGLKNRLTKTGSDRRRSLETQTSFADGLRVLLNLGRPDCCNCVHAFETLMSASV